MSLNKLPGSYATLLYRGVSVLHSATPCEFGLALDLQTVHFKPRLLASQFSEVIQHIFCVCPCCHVCVPAFSYNNGPELQGYFILSLIHSEQADDDEADDDDDDDEHVCAVCF